MVLIFEKDELKVFADKEIVIVNYAAISMKLRFEESIETSRETLKGLLKGESTSIVLASDENFDKMIFISYDQCTNTSSLVFRIDVHNGDCHLVTLRKLTVEVIEGILKNLSEI